MSTPPPPAQALEADEQPWKAPARSEREESERPAKKAKTDVLQDQASKKRNQRLFGSLMGTLNKFAKEGSKEKSSEASKRRSSLQATIASKLKAENEELHRKADRIKHEKTLKSDVARKQDEKSLLEHIHKTRQRNALHLANFLNTTASSASGPPSHPPSLATIPFDTTQPQHAAPAQDVPTIYYLPARLLDSQRAKIADQVNAATKLVDEDRSAWAAESRKLDDELEVLKEKRDKGLAELEREDRLARIEKERAERDREDSAEPKSNGHAVSTPKAEDAPMEDAVEF